MEGKKMKFRLTLKLVALFILFLPTLVCAEKKEKYFSPNNDGIQDEFIIPLKINDRRYIKSWQLVITDESNKVVRTIGNKVALPSNLNFKGFFKQLSSVKTGVAIPSSVSWNGA